MIWIIISSSLQCCILVNVAKLQSNASPMVSAVIMLSGCCLLIDYVILVCISGSVCAAESLVLEVSNRLVLGSCWLLLSSV